MSRQKMIELEDERLNRNWNQNFVEITSMILS